MFQGDECVRTIDEVSKIIEWCQNRGSYMVPGQAQRQPAYCLCGTRHKGGMALMQALVRNVGTCRLDVKGEIQVEDPRE